MLFFFELHLILPLEKPIHLRYFLQLSRDEAARFAQEVLSLIFLSLAPQLFLLKALQELVFLLLESVQGSVHFLDGSFVGSGDVFVDRSWLVDLDEVVRDFPQSLRLLLGGANLAILLAFVGNLFFPLFLLPLLLHIIKEGNKEEHIRLDIDKKWLILLRI